MSYDLWFTPDGGRRVLHQEAHPGPVTFLPAPGPGVPRQAVHVDAWFRPEPAPAPKRPLL